MELVLTQRELEQKTAKKETALGRLITCVLF
jgi:hypothetical protein